MALGISGTVAAEFDAQFRADGIGGGIEAPFHRPVELLLPVLPKAYATLHGAALVGGLQHEGKAVPFALAHRAAIEDALVALVEIIEIFGLRIAHGDDEFLHIGRLVLAARQRHGA